MLPVVARQFFNPFLTPELLLLYLDHAPLGPLMQYSTRFCSSSSWNVIFATESTPMLGSMGLLVYWSISVLFHSFLSLSPCFFFCFTPVVLSFMGLSPFFFSVLVWNAGPLLTPVLFDIPRDYHNLASFHRLFLETPFPACMFLIGAFPIFYSPGLAF